MRGGLVRAALMLLLLCVLNGTVRSQTTSHPGQRIIDMHMHTPLPDLPYSHDSARAYAQWILAKLDSLHVVLAVMSGPEDELDVYASLGSKRLIFAPMFPCDRGLDFAPGRPADMRGKLGYCLR